MDTLPKEEMSPEEQLWRSLHSLGGDNWAHGNTVAAAIEALIKKRIAEALDVDQFRKDAERYRWLRHGDNDESVVRMSGNKRNNYPFLLRNDELDSVIDAKMKE